MSFRVPVLAVATFALVGPAAAQSWGWGTGCGCSQPIAAVVDPIPFVTPPPPVAFAPVVAAGAAVVVVPNVRRPIYVVNQGPVYAGPDVTIVPSLRLDGPYQPYPYVRTFGGYDRYAVRRPYYRPYAGYRPRAVYRPVRYHPGHITRVAPRPPK